MVGSLAPIYVYLFDLYVLSGFEDFLSSEVNINILRSMTYYLGAKNILGVIKKR